MGDQVLEEDPIIPRNKPVKEGVFKKAIKKAKTNTVYKKLDDDEDGIKKLIHDGHLPTILKVIHRREENDFNPDKHDKFIKIIIDVV